MAFLSTDKMHVKIFLNIKLCIHETITGAMEIDFVHLFSFLEDTRDDK